MLEPDQILLIIQSEESANYLMEQLIIGAGYAVSVETNISAALEVFKQGSFGVVIVQICSDSEDSVRLVKGLMEVDPDVVVIGFCEKTSPEVLDSVLKLKLYDVISRPINLDRLFFLTKRSMELHELLSSQRRHTAILKEQNVSLSKQNVMLAKRIEDSTKNLARLYEDLRSTYLRTIRALAQAIDARDHYTHSHSQNVALYAVRIAKQLSLSVRDIESIREAAELHDIGKIGISDSILSKPTSLTPEEWEQIKLHPQTGSQILEPLTFLSDVIELVRQHHEHYDGKGYPQGLKKEGILLGARIIHLADAYDSMTSARSYRLIPLTREAAIIEIQKNTGTQFDPVVADAFLKIVNEL